jgi:hypothetical protein
VVNHETAADRSAGMDFYSGKKAAEMSEDAGKKSQPVTMEPGGAAVNDDGMQARIGEQYLKPRSRGRISLLNRFNLLRNEHEHCSLVSALLAGAG